jgi:hypothetical protein
MPRDTPYDMDGMAMGIPLQDQNAWSLVIRRVVLYHHSICHSCNDISHKDIILGQLIITMV